MIAPPPSGARHRLAIVLAFAALYLLWGGSYLAIRYAVAEVPPLLTIAFRCTGGAALFLLWLCLRGESLRVTGAEWRTAIVTGGLLFVGCQGILAWVEQRVSSGQAAVLLTGIPVWFVVLEALRARRLPPPHAIVALSIGTLGVLVLTSGQEWTGTLADALALAFSAFAWALGSLIARDGARPASMALAIAIQLAAGAGWMLLLALVAGEPARWDPEAVTARGVLSMGFLIVCSTVLGFGAFTWLLRVTSALAVSTYAFVNPVVALLLGWAVGDDILTGRMLLATLLVVAAVFTTRRPRALARRPRA